jgi:hypothetical protein
MEKFCESLYAAAGGLVKAGRPRIGNKQINACMGIKLKEEFRSNSFTEAGRDQAKAKRKSWR